MLNLSQSLLVHSVLISSLSAAVSFEKIHLKQEYISEGASVVDLDNDGHLDIIAGPVWWKGPDFKIFYNYVPIKEFSPANSYLTSYTDHFFVFPAMITKDNWPDIIRIGIPTSPALLAVNPGEMPQLAEAAAIKASNATETTASAITTVPTCTHHRVQNNICNESPQYLQILGEEKQLLAYSQNFITLASPSLDPSQAWLTLNISPKEERFQAHTHGLGAGDINGDGLPDILEKAGWWEQPKDWDKITPWKFHPYPFAPKQGGAQMVVYDFNGDGLNDVVTALNAHGYGLAWYQQINTAQGEISFQQHIIMPESPSQSDSGTVSFSQPHAMACADIDGDGIKDLVTGKSYYAHNGNDPGANDPAVLYWFKTTRNADGSTTFVPQLIDDDSGVGRQITVADVNGDGKLDIVTSNKKGTHAFIQK